MKISKNKLNTVIWDMYSGGYEISEIEASTGWSASSIYMRLGRILKKRRQDKHKLLKKIQIL